MNGRFAVAAPDRQTIRPDFKHLRLRAHRRRNASSETREWRRQAETRARRGYEAQDRRGRLRRRLLAQRWPSLSAKPETAAARCAAAFRLAMPMWRYTPDRRSREDASSDQARLKTSVPFVPPKPNEFFSATS